jgi:hypothetical protein
MRQEILVWTDISLYSMQYLGPPVVWGSQLLADNISILNDRAMGVASGVVYWIGEEKFYIYDGRVQTLPCDLREHVFGDFNYQQVQQVFAAVNDRFNEIWWFYCSSSATLNDRYVVYNYVEKIWYYGNMSRTAWVDSSIVSDLPIAASNSRLLYHETGCDDNATGTPVPIASYITSSEFDIDDGHNLGFVWRVLPDLTFRGSTTSTPQATMTLLPLQNSGSGYNNPLSVGGTDSQAVIRGVTIPVETFTGQVNIRVRGRQMSMKISSDGLGVQWQLGAPRIDIRPDGRGNNSNVGAISSWVGSFSGSIASPSFVVGTPYSLNLSTYFVGGLGPFEYGVSSGTLPTGLTLNSQTGLVSGTATSAGTSSVIIYRRNESFDQYVDSNPITYTVTALSPTDPYFANVGLLLHGNGANGSTTFLDSSSASRAATVIAPAQISTAFSKFGGSSGAFNGTTSRVQFAQSSAFNFGSGDLTIEAWVYIAANSPPDLVDGIRGASIVNTWPSSIDPSPGGWSFTIVGSTTNTGTGLALDSWAPIPQANGTLYRATASIAQGMWHHVAAVVSGGVRYLFLNGTLLSGSTTTIGIGYVTVNDNGSALSVGRSQSVSYPSPLNGYINDLRITKGVARYTANFTPPTEPFPNS